MTSLRTVLIVLLAALCSRADTLTTINNERFIGRIIGETADAVIFESDLAGRLTIPRPQIKELQRTSTASPTNAQPLALDPELSTHHSRPLSAHPAPLLLPFTPTDPFDWIELKSGEWLKGKIKSLQDDKLEFDSEEMEVRTFDWKDIRTVRSPRLKSVRFEDKTTAEGALLITTNEVRLITETFTNTYPRSELLAIAPTGKREIDKWSADISAGMSFRSGNTKEVEYNAHIILERRTPSTRLSLEYLGNFGSISNVQTENNHRATIAYDYFLSRRLYLRIPDIEYYSDPFLNLDYRLTLGGGLGYDFINTRKVEWNVTIGPAWQRNWFRSVGEGQNKTADGTAFVLGSRFDWDITRRIEFILEYRAQIMGRDEGDNSQHAAATLEFEIHKRLNLDLSFVWDRLAAPATESNGTTPSTDDVRLNLALGMKF